MDIKDILSVGLTGEDFDTLIEGLGAIPEKGFGQELMMATLAMVTTSGSTPQHREDAKKLAMNRFRELEKKGKTREDDLTILKSKLILLKRLLLSNEAVEMANDILRSPPALVNRLIVNQQHNSYKLIMKDYTTIPDHTCLTCHYKMDTTSSAFRGGGRQVPVKDDLSVCLRCGTVTKFDARLNSVALTEGELKELRGTHPDLYLQLIKVQKVIQAMTKQN